jgi:hypothetical protein
MLGDIPNPAREFHELTLQRVSGGVSGFDSPMKALMKALVTGTLRYAACHLTESWVGSVSQYRGPYYR